MVRWLLVEMLRSHEIVLLAEMVRMHEMVDGYLLECMKGYLLEDYCVYCDYFSLLLIIVGIHDEEVLIAGIKRFQVISLYRF